MSGFEVLITADQGMRAQQNLAAYALGIVILGTNCWPVLKHKASEIAGAVNRATPTSCQFLDFAEGHKRTSSRHKAGTQK